MTKLRNIVCSLIIVWGIYPISTFYQNVIEINDCNHKLNPVKYYFPLILEISVYSTLSLSLLIVYDIIKHTNSLIIAIILFLILAGNVITGFMLLYSIIIPNSIFKVCSTNIIIIVCLTSLVSEFIIFIVIVLCLIGILILLDGIIKIIKYHIILPFIQRDARKIFLLCLIGWTGLLLWSIILFERDRIIISLGSVQIFFSFLSMNILSKNNFTGFKKYFNFVSILGITVFLVDRYVREDGISIFGIISFLSVGFYPIYFLLIKTKIIYKSYLKNKILKMNNLPTNPPKIYANGNNSISIYNIHLESLLLHNHLQVIHIHNLLE